MEQTEFSEMLAYKIQMPGNYPEESSPITGLDRSRVFQEFKVPRFRDNGTGWW